MEVMTGPDAIRAYNTGAAADDDAQASAAASLGNHRSSSRFNGCDFAGSGGPGNITVNFVSANCGAGSASIATISADELSFTAPGGSAGPNVTILNGETKILRDGTNPSQYCEVTRTSATALSGTKTLALTVVRNNAPAQPDIRSWERIGGLHQQYHCIGIKNVGASPCQDLFAYVKPITDDEVTGVTQLAATTGSPITTNSAQLGASSNGSVASSSSGVFNSWPTDGVAKILTSGAALREYVRYHKTNLAASGSPTNFSVIFAANGNGAGTGQIRVNAGGTAVQWKPPGSTVWGPECYLASGVDRRVYGPDGNDLDKSVWVKCTGAITANQTTNITLTSTYNGDRLFVPPSGRGQGGTTPAAGANDDTITRVPGGTLATSADLDAAGWPESGFVQVRNSGGSLLEIVYFSARTGTALTIPEAGRALLGTAPTAGSNTDLMQCVPPIRVGIEAPASQPAGAFSSIANYIVAPGGSITWTTGVDAAGGASIGDLDPDEIYGIWIHAQIPPGVENTTEILQKFGLSFESP